MVEISMSGSGEGLGWATGPGYSTTILISVWGLDRAGGGHMLLWWIGVVSESAGGPERSCG